MSIEEGTPLISKPSEEEVVAPKTVNRFGLIALFSVAAIATVGALAYSSVPSANKVVSTTNLSINVPVARFADSGSSKNKLATTNNEAYKASVVEHDSKPFSSLEGVILSKPLHAGSSWTIVVDNFHHVKKVSYNKDGTVAKEHSLGKFEGLDGEANSIYVDGDYCADRKGPFYTRVGFVCGEENAITEFEQRNPCNLWITASTKKQCGDSPVKTVGTWPEQKAAQERVDKVFE